MVHEPPITYTLSPSSGPSAMSSSASLLKYTTVSAAKSSEKCCDSKRTFLHPAASCSSTSLGYTAPVGSHSTSRNGFSTRLAA
ncbi:MAG: hypothetical protein Q8P67_15750 [archaeon]|nr:hypothetical protein [archaeon]